MRSLAFPLAVLLVLLVPVALVAGAAGVAQWGGWVVRSAGVVGIIGLVVTAGFAVNLLVPRTCARIEVPGGAFEEVNRPLLSLAVSDGECYRSAVTQLGFVGLAGLATSVAAAVLSRRSAPDDSGAAPVVRSP